MRNSLIKIILIFVVLIHPACKKDSSESGTKSEKKVKKYERIKLPHELDEISGLTVSPKGELFCVNDERGIVYKIDKNDGKILDKYYLGKWTVDGDFEGLAIANKSFYVVTSGGILYEFSKADESGIADYEVYDTGLSNNYDIEGLCFDSETNSLLLACKDYQGKKLKGYRAVYSFSLDSYKLEDEPRFLIPLKELKKNFKLDEFYPSGIEKHPIRETYFILSARGETAFVEISANGKLLDAKKLDKDKHRQPEGITFLSDSIMVISDEAAGKRAVLTYY